MKTVAFAVSVQDSGKRLDIFLAERQALFTRSQVQRAIKDSRIRVDQVLQKASYHVRAGERIEVVLIDPVPLEGQAENIPLEVLYEDAALMVVNKPPGMVVHPACGNYTGTLVNALLHHCTTLSGIGGVLRPGIVHRLDKGTSGILVVAKNDTAHQGLSRQFKLHTIVRRYQALVHGSMDKTAGTIETLIGRHPTQRKKMSALPRRGRQAVTHWKVAEKFAGLTLLEVTLETGRTHQVRVHLSSMGHPVVGDGVYGAGKRKKEICLPGVRNALSEIDRPLLHAGYLQFTHPESQVLVEFAVPPPEDFIRVLQAVRTAA
ncbi:MAG: RluA family pseudouridine synthase [Proteobacteria bacterium]|nr:RluA family pseudouridine synthase [Pseudomonadota bacterium]